MTKKKRGHPDVEEILARPFCYYCERDFDDLKILINHQKAKHFKCERCGRRLNTAGGLNVHMNQVHKETLTAIENALPNRAGLDVEIFGMEGIPEEIVQQHNQRVLTQFHQAEAERRAATGNPPPGVQTSGAPKKPKFESPSELKKRLAEHKAAKLAAEQNGAGSSGANTPNSAVTQSVSVQQSAPAASPSYPGHQQPYAAPPSSATFSAPQVYNQSPVPGMQVPGYSPPSSGFLQSQHPGQQHYGQPPQPYPPSYAQPPHSSFPQPPYNTFSPPPFQNQGYPTQLPQNGPPAQVGAPRAYGSASPAPQFPHQRTHSPAQNGLPSRKNSGGLPNASGLPQRPAVSAPSVNAAQFQQMHQGQIPIPHSFTASQASNPQSREEYNPAAPQLGMPRTLSNDAPAPSSLDDLISSASKQADEVALRAKSATPKPATPQPVPASKDDASETKAVKKDKETKDKAVKPTRLVYSDNEISPEEKRAILKWPQFTSLQKAAHV